MTRPPLNHHYSLSPISCFHPAGQECPIPHPDLHHLMAFHGICPRKDKYNHPLRVVIQQRAPNTFLRFHPRLERSEMAEEFACMRFLFPQENLDTVDEWCQYVVRQENIEWDLGTWDTQIALGFLDTASKLYNQFYGGARGIVGPGFRTVWPSEWRFPIPSSTLETAILDYSRYNIGNNARHCSDFLPPTKNNNVVTHLVLSGERLERPHLLASEAFHRMPPLTREIVCQLGIAQGRQTEFLEWLCHEDAHPEVLANMRNALNPIPERFHETLEKLLVTCQLLGEDTSAKLIANLLPCWQRARMLGMLTNRPANQYSSNRREMADILVKAILNTVES